MPKKLKNYYWKQPILTFAPCNFLIFLDTHLHELKISEIISEYFANGVLVVSSGEILLIQRGSVHKRLVIGNIIANYRLLGQNAFIRGTFDLFC